MIQQSAVWPSLADFAPVSVPPAWIAYVVTELVPASPETSRPDGSKVKANGTGVADGLTIGAADSRPSAPTWNTSIELVLAFVVTSSLLPSGVKPTCPGELRKFGGVELASPSERAEPAIGATPCLPTRNPCTIPVPPELSTYARSPCTPTLAGNCPPDGSTSTSRRRSPSTRKAEMVLLPALTAISRRCRPS